MAGQLSPYPDYRDVGLPWLGRIPAHWDVRRNGRLFAQRNETCHPELPILEVSLRTGVRVRDLDSSKRKQIMDDRGKYKRAAIGDIAYNMMRMWQGAVGAAPTDGLVSPAYVVAAPFSEAETRYYSYLFRTAAYMREVDKFSRGIVSDRNRLYWDEFKQMPSVFPPTEEQTAIADFLDAHGRLTRRFIRNKRRLIALLNERRRAIINAVVTRGLNPNVCTKPTGVEWLPEIPAHWHVVPIKRLARAGAKTFTDGDWIESPFITESGIRLIQTGNIGRGYYREQGFRFIAEETFISFNCTEVDVGDILICRLGDPVSRACLAPDLGCRMITSVDVCILKANDLIAIEYGVLVLNAPQYLDWVNSLVRGSTRDRVSRTMLGSFPIPVPPRDEQENILRQIHHECGAIDSTITKAQTETDLIREYHERLIADVVTGKLDVRNVTIAAAAEDIAAEEIDEPEAGEELGDEPDVEIEAAEVED